MNSRLKISTTIYVIIYLLFVVITVVAFNELWTSGSRHGNFIYIIFFVCFLETLIAASVISANIGLFEKMGHNQNLILVLESIFGLYLVGSLILLYVGNLHYSTSPSLLYLLTIGFTLLFCLVIIWYWNRIACDSEIDNLDKNERIGRVELVSYYDKIVIGFKMISDKIDQDMKKQIIDQFDILGMKIKNSSYGKGKSITTKIDNELKVHLDNINSFITKPDADNFVKNIGNQVLGELEYIKVNLKEREAFLKK
jgi:hypothetical protein